MHSLATSHHSSVPGLRDAAGRGTATGTPRFTAVRIRWFCALVLVLGSAPAAHAVDGCKVMLCLAASDWRQIPECVPDVTRALHDVHHGRPFPRCDNAGSGNASDHEWSDPPWNCPQQYLHRIELEDRIDWTCDYIGAVTVIVNGSLFTRTWWSGSDDTVTEFSPAAKLQLRTWNPRYDDEYAAWLSAQPARPAQPGSAE